GLEHAVSCERHVAVVALTAAGGGQVVGMSGQFRSLAEALVTLGTGPVVRAIAGQLIVRITFMQRVTGETGEFASLVAGGLQQPVVLATADSDHPVRPEIIAKKVRIASEKIGEPGDRCYPRRTDDRSGGFQIVAGTVMKSVLNPVLGV